VILLPSCLPCPVLSCPVLSRLFAVGYAARQVSSRTLLERLLSNSPTAAAGLGLHPADWVLAGPQQAVCGTCDNLVCREQVPQREGVRVVCVTEGEVSSIHLKQLSAVSCDRCCAPALPLKTPL
jgi:hypothetical protein